MVCFVFHPYWFAISFPISGLLLYGSNAKKVGGPWFNQTLFGIFADSIYSLEELTPNCILVISTLKGESDPKLATH